MTNFLTLRNKLCNIASLVILLMLQKTSASVLSASHLITSETTTTKLGLAPSGYCGDNEEYAYHLNWIFAFSNVVLLTLAFLKCSSIGSLPKLFFVSSFVAGGVAHSVEDHLGNSLGIHLAFVGAAVILSKGKFWVFCVQCIALWTALWCLPPFTEVEVLTVQLLLLSCLMAWQGKKVSSLLTFLSWICVVVDEWDVTCQITFGSGTHWLTHFLLNFIMDDFTLLITKVSSGDFFSEAKKVITGIIHNINEFMCMMKQYRFNRVFNLVMSSSSR